MKTLLILEKMKTMNGISKPSAPNAMKKHQIIFTSTWLKHKAFKVPEVKPTISLSAVSATRQGTLITLKILVNPTQKVNNGKPF